VSAIFAYVIMSARICV